MKCLLLACLIATSVAQLSGSAFEEGHEYVYRYEAQIMTGAPSASDLWSGLYLRADVHLYPQKSGRTIIKMQDVSLERKARNYDWRSPNYFMQSGDSSNSNVDTALDVEMIQQLQKPFEVFYGNGAVLEVRLDSHTKRAEFRNPEWSRNIKRGVASIFQVNLNRQYSVNQPSGDKATEYNPLQASYTVWESSLYGWCLTTYSPKPRPVSQQFYLTKTRNMSSCLQKPSQAYVYDNFRSNDQKTKSKHLDVQAQVTYAIKGDKKRFTIMSATGEGKITFTPYSFGEGNVEASINQTMYLTSKMSMGKKPIPTADTKCRLRKGCNQRLAMVAPEDVFQDLEPYTETYRPESKAVRIWDQDKLDQLLTWAANATWENPSKEVIISLQTLLTMVRQSRPDDLKKFLSEVVRQKLASKESQRPDSMPSLKSKMLWNVLTSCGSTNCAEAMLDECIANKNKQTLEDECNDAYTAIGLFTPPSQKVIVKIYSVVRTLNKRSSLLKKSAVILAYGSLIGRANEVMDDIQASIQKHLDGHKQIMDQNTAQKRSQELQESQKRLSKRQKEIRVAHSRLWSRFSSTMRWRLIRSSSSTWDRILALKAMRNAHVYSSATSDVMNVLLTSPNTLIRVAAAQSFDKFASAKPSVKAEILNKLEMVFRNPVEETAVRTQALRSILAIGPSAEMLIRMAQQNRYEQNKQVSTYLSSALQELQNCSFKSYHELSSAARSASPFIKPQPIGWQDSRISHSFQPIAKHLGWLQESSYVSSGDQEPITVLDTSAILDLFCASNKAFQVTWMSKGFQKVLKKLAGPEGLLTQKNSWLDLLSPARGPSSRPKNTPHQVDSAIKHFFEKLNVTDRKLTDEPEAYVSLQLMNNVVRVWSWSEILKNIVEIGAGSIQTDFDESRWRLGKNFDYKTSGILQQFHMSVPTEVGLPVSLQMSLGYSAQARGRANISVDSSVFYSRRQNKADNKDVSGESRVRDDLAPKTVKAGITVDPKLYGQVTGRMYVDGYLFNAGTLFYASAEEKVPVSAQVTYDIKRSHLSTRIDPPTSQYEPVLKFKMEPMIYSSAISKSVQGKDPISKRPLFVNSQKNMIANRAQKQVVYKVMDNKLFGYTVDFEGEYPQRSYPSAPVNPLTGPHNYALYLRSRDDHPAQIRSDVRFFSKSKYSQDSKASDGFSFTNLFGYISDEEDSFDGPPKDDDKTVTEEYQDFPNLEARPQLSFESVRRRIQERLETEVPLYPSSGHWAFIWTVNTTSQWSSPRAWHMDAILSSLNGGQKHKSYIAYTSTPLPGYDHRMWNLSMESSLVYPTEKYSEKDLLTQKYNIKLMKSISNLVNAKEHKPVNSKFQSQVISHISKTFTRLTATVSAKDFINKRLPEKILDANVTRVITLARSVLSELLPLTKQVDQLYQQAWKSVNVKDKEREIQVAMEILSTHIQPKIVQIFNASDTESMPQCDHTAVRYTIYKASHVAFKLKEMAERAKNLNPRTDLGKTLAAVEKWQADIFADKSSMIKVSPRSPDYHDQSDDDDHSAYDEPGPDSQEPTQYGGHYSYENSYEDESSQNQGSQNNQKTSVSLPVLKNKLKNLISSQHEQLMEAWKSLNEKQRKEVNSGIDQSSRPSNLQITKLVEDIASPVIAELNEAIKAGKPMRLDTDLHELIFQATIQHQTLVELLNVWHQRKDGQLWKPVQLKQDLQSLKSGAEELAQRVSILDEQNRYDSVCKWQISAPNQQQVDVLDQQELRMVSLQYHVQRSYEYDQEKQKEIAKELRDIFEKMKLARDLTASSKRAPHPCFAVRLSYDVISLQRAVSQARSSLLSSPYSSELVSQYERLEENVMQLLGSLTPIFDKYSQHYTSSTSENSIFAKEYTSQYAFMRDLEYVHQKQGELRSKQDKFYKDIHEQSLDEARQPAVSLIINSFKLAQRLSQIIERIEMSWGESRGYFSPEQQSVSSEKLFSTLQRQRDILLSIMNLALQFKYADLAFHWKIDGEIADVEKKIEHDQWAMEREKKDNPWSTYNEDSEYEPLPESRAGYRSPQELQGQDEDNSHRRQDRWNSRSDESQREEGNYSEDSDADQDYDMDFDEDDDEPKKRNRRSLLNRIWGSQSESAEDQGADTPFGPEIRFEADIKYGSVGGASPRKSLKIKVRAMKSVEQMYWESSQYWPNSRSECTSQAIEDVVSQRERMSPCATQLRKMMNTYPHIHISAKSSPFEMPAFVEQWVWWSQHSLLHKFYSQSRVQNPQPFITDRSSFHAVWDVSPNLDKVDQYWMTANETTEIQSIPVPSVVKAWYPFQNEEPLLESALKRQTRQMVPATCQIDRQSVRTVDGYMYQIPNSKKQCHTVVAMDCSPEKTFAIIYEPTEEGSEEEQAEKSFNKAITIYAEGQSIYVSPNQVTVDDVDIDVESSKNPLYQSWKQIAYDQKAVKVWINKRDKGWIHVELPQVGVNVLYKNNYIKIQVASVFQNQLCGMCGNYDGQPTLELQGPQKEIYSTPRDFFMSYVLPDKEGCKIPRQMSKARNVPKGSYPSQRRRVTRPKYGSYRRGGIRRH